MNLKVDAVYPARRHQGVANGGCGRHSGVALINEIAVTRWSSRRRGLPGSPATSRIRPMSPTRR